MLSLVNAVRDERDISKSKTKAKDKLDHILKYAIVKSSNPFIPIEITDKKQKPKGGMPEPYFFCSVKAGPMLGTPVVRFANGMELGANLEASRAYSMCLSKSGLDFNKTNRVGGTFAVPGVSFTLNADLKNKNYMVSMDTPLGAGGAATTKDKGGRPGDRYYYLGSGVPFGVPLIIDFGGFYAEVGVALPKKEEKIKPQEFEMKDFTRKRHHEARRR